MPVKCFLEHLINTAISHFSPVYGTGAGAHLNSLGVAVTGLRISCIKEKSIWNLYSLMLCLSLRKIALALPCASGCFLFYRLQSRVEQFGICIL